LLALAGVAHAQPKRKAAPDKFAKAASEAFNAAVDADTKGDLRTALALFEKAHAISPHPSTIFNVADVNRRLGQLKPAIRGFETYLAMAPDAKDRADVEKTLDELYKTPGTIFVITTEATDRDSVDLTAGFILVSGEIKKRPGPVPVIKPRNITGVTLTVPPGEHVVDFVTPITYATRQCEVGPGEQRWCELKAEPRIDGNAVVSAYDRSFDVIAERRGKDLVYKRFDLPAGKHRLLVKDRSFGCAPLPMESGGNNTVAYAFLGTTEYKGLKRCRTIDIKQHRLQFDP
jgi:hypothetical protein